MLSLQDAVYICSSSLLALIFIAAPFTSFLQVIHTHTRTHTHTFIYTEQSSLALNLTSKNNLWVFIGDSSQLVKLVINFYLIPVFFIPSLINTRPSMTACFLYEESVRNFRNLPDPYFTFIDFFQSLCDRTFSHVLFSHLSRNSHLYCEFLNLPYGHDWSEVPCIPMECFLKISVIFVTFHYSSARQF